MDAITITQRGEVIASHTSDHVRSSYGQLIWSINIPNPPRGMAEWKQNDNVQKIQIIAVIDGWLVCKQNDGSLSAIIWSDGNYYAELIIDRSTKQVISRATKKDLQSFKYQVRGTIAAGEFGGMLGSILNL